MNSFYKSLKKGRFFGVKVGFAELQTCYLSLLPSDEVPQWFKGLGFKG